MSGKKELRKLYADAERNGWTITTRKGGHVKLTHPQGGIVFGPSTPSEYRGIKNLRSLLRKKTPNWKD